MKKVIKNILLYFIAFYMLFLTQIICYATTNTAIISSHWSNNSTWSLNRIPISTDTIIIPIDKYVNFHNSYSLNGSPTYIRVLGTLSFEGHILTLPCCSKVEVIGKLKGTGILKICSIIVWQDNDLLGDTTLTSCLSLSLNTNNDNVIISNNPVKKDIGAYYFEGELYYNLDDEYEINMIDISGNIILKNNISGSGILNINNINIGIYYVYFISYNNSFKIKILI